MHKKLNPKHASEAFNNKPLCSDIKLKSYKRKENSRGCQIQNKNSKRPACQQFVLKRTFLIRQKNERTMFKKNRHASYNLYGLGHIGELLRKKNRYL